MSPLTPIGVHRTLEFFVPGTPRPQGSVSNFGGRIVSVKKPLKSWRELIVTHADEARETIDWPPMDGPLGVRLRFVMPKPKRPKFKLPAVPPDIDKLERAVFDALTLAKVWVDDGRVIAVAKSQHYADAWRPPAPGVHIRVWEGATPWDV